MRPPESEQPVSRETGQSGREAIRRVATWTGHDLNERTTARLGDYRDWLIEEAIPAGGLGPREGERIWSRHIADSLSFAAGWRTTPPPEILDVGSGVGLPGIPLAMLFPDTPVTLLDRGGRRVRLLRRVVRVLAIENVIVAQGDVFSVADEWMGVVYRGAVPPPEGVGLSARLLDVGGTAVFGLSRRAERPAEADDLVHLAGALGMEGTVERVPPEILDGGAWLFIMRLGD